MPRHLVDCADQDLTAPPGRLAFFDLDGTLIGSDHSVAPAVLAEIARVRAAGVAVAIASGRPHFAARDIERAIGVNAPSVFFSGALITEPHRGPPLFEASLEPALLEAVVRTAHEHQLYIELYTREGYFITAPHPLALVHAEYLRHRAEIVSFPDLIATERILKIVTVSDRAADEAALRAITTRFPGLTWGLGHGAAHPNLLFGNATSAAASREHAFELITNHLGIQADAVLAFGDGEADMPFLRLAGRGVAMGNARPEVQAAARYVTHSVEERGVAYALRRLIPV